MLTQVNNKTVFSSVTPIILKQKDGVNALTNLLGKQPNNYVIFDVTNIFNKYPVKGELGRAALKGHEIGLLFSGNHYGMVENNHIFKSAEEIFEYTNRSIIKMTTSSLKTIDILKTRINGRVNNSKFIING